MYYGRDTFYLEGAGTKAQMPYQMLGAVIAYAHPKMVDAIIQSCYFGVRLGDNAAGFSAEALLLEAHIFGEVTFMNNLVAVRIPKENKGTPIGDNAAKFARKHGAKLEWLPRNKNQS